eukprot:m.303005 g.303005  ORF g.303005 m.303005 type:complete len:248 (+) comp15890_c0_seq31:83-826(+)
MADRDVEVRGRDSSRSRRSISPPRKSRWSTSSKRRSPSRSPRRRSRSPPRRRSPHRSPERRRQQRGGDQVDRERGERRDGHSAEEERGARRDERRGGDRGARSEERRGGARRRAESPTPRSPGGREQWGVTEEDSDQPTKPKLETTMANSGLLADEANTFNGVVINYAQPPEARVPKQRWRFYPFKGKEALDPMYLHRQSAFLIGRDHSVRFRSHPLRGVETLVSVCRKLGEYVVGCMHASWVSVGV